MSNKIIEGIAHVFIFILFNNICRTCSAYFDKSKCKKYIEIKSNLFSRVLISRQISRDKFVKPMHYNHLSYVGIFSYIFLFPTNLCFLIINILRVLNEHEDLFLEKIYILNLLLLIAFLIIFIMAYMINTSKVNK